jgi:hypothetical protein
MYFVGPSFDIKSLLRTFHRWAQSGNLQSAYKQLNSRSLAPTISWTDIKISEQTGKTLSTLNILTRIKIFQQVSPAVDEKNLL